MYENSNTDFLGKSQCRHRVALKMAAPFIALLLPFYCIVNNNNNNNHVTGLAHAFPADAQQPEHMY